MKLIPLSAAVLAAALTLANAASAAGPLPAPPPPGSPTSTNIFEAMLAIARAAVANPSGAQQATFSYYAAIQQYNAHDFARSNASALTAIGQTAVPPLPQPSLWAPPIPQPTFYSMPRVANANQADAEAFVSLARRAMMTCGAPNAAPPAIVQQNAVAVDALVSKKYEEARASAEWVVNECGAATRTYAAQQAAKPQPSPTDIPMGAYSPLPIATLGPDPALAGVR